MMRAGDPSADPMRRGFAPVVSRDARLLVLGSFPSVASLAAGQYYAHPRNQFWPIIGAVIDEALVPLPYPDRLQRLRARRIALWDVVGSCRRRGSLDSAIRDAVDNGFDALLAQAPGIVAVAFNGATAARHAPWFEARGLAVFRMPSTSPAHASLSFERKRDTWLAVRTVLA